jgi:hypothetical protein
MSVDSQSLEVGYNIQTPVEAKQHHFNQGYLFLKGLRKVKGEVGFTMLANNMRRVINILGVGALVGLHRA